MALQFPSFLLSNILLNMGVTAFLSKFQPRNFKRISWKKKKRAENVTFMFGFHFVLLCPAADLKYLLSLFPLENHSDVQVLIIVSVFGTQIKI